MVRGPKAPGGRSGARSGGRRGREPLTPGTAADVAQRIIDAALEAAAEKGWIATSFAEIATRAGVSLADLYAVFPSKVALINGFIERIDREVLAGVEPDAGESARDRLFDVLMRCFDALAPHRAGVAAIARGIPADPFAAVCVLPRLLRSLAWALEAAGLSSAGAAGAMRVKGLALVYANAFRVWLRDDTADMAKTMAALDAGLRRAESMAVFCGLARSAGGPEAARPPAPRPDRDRP